MEALLHVVHPCHDGVIDILLDMIMKSSKLRVHDIKVILNSIKPQGHRSELPIYMSL